MNAFQESRYTSIDEPASARSDESSDELLPVGYSGLTGSLPTRAFTPQHQSLIESYDPVVWTRR